MRLFDTVTQSVLDTGNTLYFEKKKPAKLLKTYFKDNGNVYFVVI